MGISTRRWIQGSRGFLSCNLLEARMYRTRRSSSDGARPLWRDGARWIYCSATLCSGTRIAHVSWCRCLALESRCHVPDQSHEIYVRKRGSLKARRRRRKNPSQIPLSSPVLLPVIVLYRSYLHTLHFVSRCRCLPLESQLHVYRTTLMKKSRNPSQKFLNYFAVFLPTIGMMPFIPISRHTLCEVFFWCVYSLH